MLLYDIEEYLTFSEDMLRNPSHWLRSSLPQSQNPGPEKTGKLQPDDQ